MFIPALLDLGELVGLGQVIFFSLYFFWCLHGDLLLCRLVAAVKEKTD